MSNPHIERAGSYLRGNEIFIFPVSKATNNLWYDYMPVSRVDINCDDSELGSIIMDVLSQSTAGINPPESPSPAAIELFRLTGVKGWRQFSKGTIACDISRINGVVAFAPSHQDDKHGGYSGKNTGEILAPIGSSSTTLGRSLKQALYLSD